MRILDLYAGLGGESRRKAIEARGHTLVTLDLEQKFNCTITGDMMTIDPVAFLATHGRFDFIWASPPCFTGDQLVLTMRGHVPIENIRVGDMVLTHLCRWRPVTAIGRKKVNAVKVLRGYGTNEIKATSNHPFLARSLINRKLGPSSWVQVCDMVGKHWAIPTSTESIIHELPENPYIIGRWLGDGWLNIDRGEVMICCGKSETSELKSILETKSNADWIMSETRTATRFTTCNKELAWWLQSNFRSGAHNKIIPGWIFGANINVRQEILKGYVDADGHVTDTYIRTSSTSKSLSHGIQLLAITLGKTACITYRKSKTGKCVIEGRIVNEHDSWAVLIRESNSTREYFRKPGDGLGYGKVRSSEWQIGEIYVYDITVDEDHTYTINNVVVHNCTAFSVASLGHHWTGGKGAYVPKTQLAVDMQALVVKTLDFIRIMNPDGWIMENPRGVLRKLPCVAGVPMVTVSYCRYGDNAMKPTDLWGHVKNWVPRPMCANGHPDHDAAPRGSRTGGTQGKKGAALRAVVPWPLWADILWAMEGH